MIVLNMFSEQSPICHWLAKEIIPPLTLNAIGWVNVAVLGGSNLQKTSLFTGLCIVRWIRIQYFKI